MKRAPNIARGRRPRWAGLLVWLGLLWHGVAAAQVLSSPLGPSPSGVPAGPVHGQGPGVHSPLSPIAPLKPRTDVVAWSVLTDVSTRVEQRRLVPVFPPAVQALDGRTVRVQGFMMPLEPGESQRHFLLSSVPLTCAFCIPGGPESLVEVRAREPVRYTQGAVVVQGRLRALTQDPQGLYYRLTEATAVK